MKSERILVEWKRYLRLSPHRRCSYNCSHTYIQLLIGIYTVWKHVSLFYTKNCTSSTDIVLFEVSSDKAENMLVLTATRSRYLGASFVKGNAIWLDLFVSLLFCSSFLFLQFRNCYVPLNSLHKLKLYIVNSSRCTSVCTQLLLMFTWSLHRGALECQGRYYRSIINST